MSVVRSLLFYAVFYLASVYYVLGSVLMVALAPQHIRRFPDAWSRFHRVCMRVLLGITVRETGSRPQGTALYAFKHESFFEAIDLPNTLDFPVPFGPIKAATSWRFKSMSSLVKSGLSFS